MKHSNVLFIAMATASVILFTSCTGKKEATRKTAIVVETTPRPRKPNPPQPPPSTPKSPQPPPIDLSQYRYIKTACTTCGCPRRYLARQGDSVVLVTAAELNKNALWKIHTGSLRSRSGQSIATTVFEHFRGGCLDWGNGGTLIINRGGCFRASGTHWSRRTRLPNRARIGVQGAVGYRSFGSGRYDKHYLDFQGRGNCHPSLIHEDRVNRNTVGVFWLVRKEP